MRSLHLLIPLAVFGSAGCNAYDYFRLTGLQQEGFSNKADILLVIDNSTSMTDEARALAENFGTFIEDFSDDPPTIRPDLGEELDRYLDYVEDRSANLNYQIGITTTEVFAESGMLLGPTPFISVLDRDIPARFNENLLCDAACFGTVPKFAEDCANPQSPQEELECSAALQVPKPECPIGGPQLGRENCAETLQGASEEPIEAAFMAMCRAVEDPPEACFQEWYWWPALPQSGDENGWAGHWSIVAPTEDDYPPSIPFETEPVPYFGEDEVLSNDGWLRDRSVVIPVLVTDEGDQSRRIAGRTGEVFPYPELFRQFGHRVTWATIGPNLDCNTAGAVEWGVRRMQDLVASSNGVWVDLNETVGNECQASSFDDALTEIGRLLRGLADTFPLAAVPVPESIVVNVNGERIRPAEPREEDGRTVYGDGWHYEVSQNAVVLSGAVVPDYNADVDIWYLPASGVPRDLPF